MCFYNHFIAYVLLHIYSCALSSWILKILTLESMMILSDRNCDICYSAVLNYIELELTRVPTNFISVQFYRFHLHLIIFIMFLFLLINLLIDLIYYFYALAIA